MPLLGDVPLLGWAPLLLGGFLLPEPGSVEPPPRPRSPPPSSISKSKTSGTSSRGGVLGPDGFDAGDFGERGPSPFFGGRLASPSTRSGSLVAPRWRANS